MSINRAIGNAFSGLTAQARAAELVSRNLSNASVDGYAARQAALVHQVYGDQGGGVKVSAVTRAGDPMLTASRRMATADTSLQSGDAENLRALADLLGIEGVDESLAARYADLEEALGALADAPESATVQRSAAEAANMLARSFNVVSTDARRLRVEADENVSRQVEKVNAALAKIERLNKEIQSAAAAGRDATGLEDERDRQIEIVNAIVPIRAKQTENGGVELRSAAGTLLVGSKAWPLVKDPPAMPSGVYSTGPDGAATPPNLAPGSGAGSGALRGGSLEAAFRMRDDAAPKFLAQLDAMAADLILRFQAVTGAGGADAPATPGGTERGIFVDSDAAGDRWLDGAGATAASIDGLAERLKVNDAILDAPQKLQKGLYANKPDIGDATVPRALLDAFRGTPSRQTPGTPPLAAWSADIVANLPANAGAAEMATAFAADRRSLARGAEVEASYRQGLSEALRENELAGTAVDTDAELRELLAIEKAYAANARVLQTVDEMMRVILEI